MQYHYTGWPHRSYKLNRPLNMKECDAGLTQDDMGKMKSDDSMFVCSYNSTYMECIDHRFDQRGGFDTVMQTWGGLGIVLFSLVAGFYYFPYILDYHGYGVLGKVIGSLPILLLAVVGSAWYWFSFLRYDYFVNTHNPIRFNRKNRKIYVYRDRYSGGLLEANFDDVFFFIATEGSRLPVSSLRGHIIKGDTIVDTFSVGVFYDKDNEIWLHQFWEFLCRYMNEGPEAPFEDEKDKYIHISVATTWKNCYTRAAASLAPIYLFRIPLFFIVYPIVFISTATKWLVMRTCDEPVWPAHIEEACKIEKDDPWCLPEPEYMYQFAENNPELAQWVIERDRKPQR